jgi:hypothetical protein
MNDQAIEQEIQAKGKTAPRVTPADIEANIASEHYFTAGAGCGDAIYPSSLDLLTFCVLVLRNGFTVTGESACASPENFDAEIGRKVARQNAVQKIWPLMGYQLRDDLYRRAVFDAEPKTGAGANLAALRPERGAAYPGYSTLAPHQQRVVDERAELDDKRAKLLAFFDTTIFAGLDEAEQSRLRQQMHAMACISAILDERIAAFAPA